MAKPTTRRGVVTSVLVGLLTIPALAFAGASILAAGPEADLGVAAIDLGTADTPVAAAPFASPQSEPQDIGADIARACGAVHPVEAGGFAASDGASLVAKEAAGTISALEQAALDALRPICEDAGRPLPDSWKAADIAATAGATVDEVIFVQAVSSAAPALSTTATVAVDSQFEDDHEDDHEDDREDDREDEHEDEHEEEDD